MKKISKKALALSLATVMAVPALPISSLGTLDAQAAESISRVMVHDPSIFEYNDEYYVFGSHIATAKSSDLVGTYLGVGDNSNIGISIDSNDSKMFYTFSYLGKLGDLTDYSGGVLQDASIVGNTLKFDIEGP